MLTRCCLALALFVFACGGSTDQDASPGGGAAGTGGGAGSGGTAGTGGAACADYLDQSGQEVTVRIKNETSAPVFMGGSNDCGPVEVFAVKDPTGADVKLFAGGCGHTCEALQQHGNYCTGACMMPALIRIDPGGHYDRKWSGTVFEQKQMPSECYVDLNTAMDSCEQRVAAPAGDYGFFTSAATSASCNGGSCDCAPNAAGSCEIAGGGQLGTTLMSAAAKLAFPSESLVELSLQ